MDVHLVKCIGCHSCRESIDQWLITAEQIRSDVNGPMSTAPLGKARYCVCFKDEFGKFGRAFFIKQKTTLLQPLDQSDITFRKLIHEIGGEYLIK